MAGPRRVAPAPAVVQPPPPAASGLMFGDLDFYVGGFTLPEGRYALEFDVRMHAGTKADGTPAGPARLGIMIGAYPLTGGPASNQFLSLGSKAHLSFAPDPNTGKGLVSVPGGPGANANNKTNWFLFLKSLYDCGLPAGIFQNDLTTIDGIWVQTQNIPEPEERKGFGAAKTGEAVEEKRGPSLIPIVTEILDGGKPWEGSGGFEGLGEEAAPATPATPAARVAPKAPGAPIRPAAVAPAAPAAEAPADEDTLTSAINGISAVLEANPKGCTKLLLRTGTFKAVSGSAGAEVANAVLNQFFGTDAALNSVLGSVGYVVQGGNVVPQA